VLTATAAGSVGWHRLASDPPNDARVKALTAYLASDRASARAFSGELTYKDPAKLARVDFATDVVVAVFDGPTCRPHLPVVSSLSQRGNKLIVRLRGPVPEASGCHPKWPGGYELVTVPRSGLRAPYPTGVVARYS
jgi:hypothetical protein